MICQKRMKAERQQVYVDRIRSACKWTQTELNSREKGKFFSSKCYLAGYQSIIICYQIQSSFESRFERP